MLVSTFMWFRKKLQIIFNIALFSYLHHFEIWVVREEWGQTHIESGQKTTTAIANVHR